MGRGVYRGAYTAAQASASREIERPVHRRTPDDRADGAGVAHRREVGHRRDPARADRRHAGARDAPHELQVRPRLLPTRPTAVTRKPGAPAARSHPSVAIRSRSTASAPRARMRPSGDLDAEHHLARPRRLEDLGDEVLDRPARRTTPPRGRHPPRGGTDLTPRCARRRPPGRARRAAPRSARTTSRLASPPNARSMSTTCSHRAPASRHDASGAASGSPPNASSRGGTRRGVDPESAVASDRSREAA